MTPSALHARTCSTLRLALTALLAVAACHEPTAPAARATGGPRLAAAKQADIQVSTLAALYAAVNDPANAGRRVAVAPGTYLLDSTQCAAPCTTGGRLELQPDMTLAGATGHPGDVIIDATSASFTPAPGLSTGAIRIGRGTNAVESLTIRNSARGVAGIETDLVSAGPVFIRIDDVVATGNVRGIDIRNIGAASVGRVITASLTGNELYGNVTGMGQGLRVVNTGTANATIHVALAKNHSHANLVGCLVSNLNSTGSAIDFDSHGDGFDSNGNGCIFLGGLNSTPATPANDNSIDVRVHASRFMDNIGPRSMPGGPSGGIVAFGGSSPTPGKANHDSIRIQTWGTKIGNNGGPDIAAWGAQSAGPAPAGVYDTVFITVHGRPLVILAVDSTPVDPTHTDRVIVSP